MKISDIIKGKEDLENLERPVESGEYEAEKLMQQKEDLNKEIEESYQGPEVEPEPESEPLPPAYQAPAPKADLEPPAYVPPPPTQARVRPSLFKFTFVLEDGTKLCPVFECPKEKLDEVMEAVDRQIMAGEIITIAEYKILPSRIMYIDLKGRD